MARVVDTDNFGGDYPDEKFVTGVVTKDEAEAVAAKHNDGMPDWASRYYTVVEDDYVLAPGFKS